MKPLIEIHGLRYRYPDGTEALRGVDFRLDAGENVALLGPNGSGKTTFVLHLNGLLTGGEGTVEVAGVRLTGGTAGGIRGKVGLVFQDSESQLFMPTVLEDVAFGPLNQGFSEREAERRARSALEKVRIAGAADKAPYHLSSGEKKRVAIAGILAMEPEILVLDEPTTYLDPPGQAALIELLRELPQAKILVTHDISFARALCDRAVFFQDGTIAGEGLINDVIACFGWEAPHPRAHR